MVNGTAQKMKKSLTENFIFFVVGFKPLTNFAKRSILDVRQGSEYTFKYEIENLVWHFSRIQSQEGLKSDKYLNMES